MEKQNSRPGPHRDPKRLFPFIFLCLCIKNANCHIMVRIKRTISFCPDPSEAQPHLVPDHISVSRTRNALAHKTKLGVIMHQFVFAGEYESLSPLCFRFADHMIQQSSRTAAAVSLLSLPRFSGRGSFPFPPVPSAGGGSGRKAGRNPRSALFFPYYRKTYKQSLSYYCQHFHYIYRGNIVKLDFAITYMYISILSITGGHLWQINFPSVSILSLCEGIYMI